MLMGAALAHSLVGEKVVLRRLYRRGGARAEVGRRAGDDPSTRRAVRLAWHSLSVSLMGYAAILMSAGVDYIAVRDGWSAIAPLITVTFVGLTLLSLIISRGRHIGWMWYAAGAAAAWLSAR